MLNWFCPEETRCVCMYIDIRCEHSSVRELCQFGNCHQNSRNVGEYHGKSETSNALLSWWDLAWTRLANITNTVVWKCMMQIYQGNRPGGSGGVGSSKFDSAVFLLLYFIYAAPEWFRDREKKRERMVAMSEKRIPFETGPFLQAVTFPGWI